MMFAPLVRIQTCQDYTPKLRKILFSNLLRVLCVSVVNFFLTKEMNETFEAIDTIESSLQEAEKELNGKEREQVNVFKERINKAKEVRQLTEGLLGIVLAKQ